MRGGVNNAQHECLSEEWRLQLVLSRIFLVFFFNDTATTEIYTLSLHDALPILFSCLGAEGSKGSLFRNGWFQCFSV